MAFWLSLPLPLDPIRPLFYPNRLELPTCDPLRFWAEVAGHTLLVLPPLRAVCQML